MVDRNIEYDILTEEEIITGNDILKYIIDQIALQDYGRLTEDSIFEITGQIIVRCLHNLYEICSVQRPPTIIQLCLFDFLSDCINKCEEVRQFLYKYNFLALMRYLLINFPTNRVVEILCILCQVKIDGTNPDYVVEMIEWIGKDCKLVYRIIFYLWIGQIMVDTPLIENIVKFLYSVALVIKMRPTSKWVVHLKQSVFKFVIYDLLKRNHKGYFLTIILDILVILSEVILPETSNNSSILSYIFDMEEMIVFLYDMQYFSINHNSTPHWEFYKNWLTLVNNIKEKNLFVFNQTNLTYVRNIYSHVHTILIFFEKALRMILKKHTKRTISFLRLFEHTIVVDKCMRLAAEFKKCKISLITNLQVTCGIEQKFLTIRVLLDVLDDALFCKLRLFNQTEGSDTETEVSPETALDCIANFKKSLDEYLDSVIIEHSNDYYVLYNIVYQCVYHCEENQIVIGHRTIAQEQAIEYLDHVEARILYMTRNDKTHRLRQIFNTVKKKIEEYRSKQI